MLFSFFFVYALQCCPSRPLLLRAIHNHLAYQIHLFLLAFRQMDLERK